MITEALVTSGSLEPLHRLPNVFLSMLCVESHHKNTNPIDVILNTLLPQRSHWNDLKSKMWTGILYSHLSVCRYISDRWAPFAKHTQVTCHPSDLTGKLLRIWMVDKWFYWLEEKGGVNVYRCIDSFKDMLKCHSE